jgi:hypothetical protein
MPVIPGTWELEVGGLESKASLGKSMRPYLKNIFFILLFICAYKAWVISPRFSFVNEKHLQTKAKWAGHES